MAAAPPSTRTLEPSPTTRGDDEGGAAVRVWWTPASVPEEIARSLRETLDDETVRRVDAMVRAQDRRRSIVAHGLMRRVVGQQLGIGPREVQVGRLCAGCGATDHGKPHLLPERPGQPPTIQFNLAHSGDLVAVALAPGGMSVGIDLELVDRSVDWGAVQRHVFSDVEWERSGSAPDPAAARFALWARKEAAAKCTGIGLSVDLSAVTLHGTPGGDGAFRGHLDHGAVRHDVLVRDLVIDAGFAAAVAVPDHGTAPAVIVRQANFT